MKRVIIFITLSLIVLGFSSCSKDNDVSGTKWLGAVSGTAVELYFTNTDFELKGINQSDVITGNYVYEVPNITCVATLFKDSFGNIQYGGGTFTGVVDGKVLTLNIGGRIVKFIKQ